jgi:hypothetical protein
VGESESEGSGRAKGPRLGGVNVLKIFNRHVHNGKLLYGGRGQGVSRFFDTSLKSFSVVFSNLNFLDHHAAKICFALQN